MTISIEEVEKLLSPLTDIVKKLGVKEVPYLSKNNNLPQEFTIRDPGMEFTKAMLKHRGGRLEIGGRPILLYIPGGSSYRFHIAQCQTIQQMHTEGRLRRYIITNKTTGIFKTSMGMVRLDVCKNCLFILNYKGYRQLKEDTRKDWAVKSFNIEEFFKDDTCIPIYPEGELETLLNDENLLLENVYLQSWGSVTRAVREARGWRCEVCGVDLSDHHDLLHTHHLNGNKQDEAPENLQVLCLLCHAEIHGHMHVDPDARQLIQERRDELQANLGKFKNL